MNPRAPIRRRCAALLFAVYATALLMVARLKAEDFKIVANASVGANSISPSELRRVFLLETSSLDDGSHVVPVLETKSAAHNAFLKQFLDINDDALRDYYRTLVFTGKAPMPKDVASDAEMVAYVAKTRGAIGYVGMRANTGALKVLVIASSAGTHQRTLVTRIEPVYPETLKRLDIGGVVRLQVTISSNGSVENVVLIGGNPILAEAAIAAVKQWVYAAASARTINQVSITFQSHP